MLGRVVMVVLFLLVVAPAHAQQACGDGQYEYGFTSWCAGEVWLGERSTGDPQAYPPQSGSWALAGRCTANADCASKTCDLTTGECTCTTAGDCGGAACQADGKCASTSVVCLPKAWSSGTLWPRTGCALDASASPPTLTCATGACYDTRNTGKQLLDCSVANHGGSPTNPVTQLEVTSSATAVNYDVSLAAGYNVETRVVPVGGGQVVPGTPASEVAACYPAGCDADLNATCPAALQASADGAIVGCLDPCTRCQRPDPAASLACTTGLADTWSCDGDSGHVTNLDLYCAKNAVDGHPQASPNQGTPTAFAALDCPPATSFVTPTFAGAYALPAGQGVCLYTSAPQSTIPHFNDYGWADAPSGTTKSCGGLPPDYVPLVDGTACGGYRTAQTDGGSYADAVGYTCQTATFPASDGGTLTAHLCMPPTTSGLGACTADSKGGLPLYGGTGGVANASWIAAATLAGGGTPYYVPFKTACQAAYAWQYDDIASGFGCDPTLQASGSAFSGFDVTFCGSRAPQSAAGGGRPDRVVALDVRGRATGVGGRAGRGRISLVGRASVPASLAIDGMQLVVHDLLDAVGGDGERVAGTLPLTLVAHAASHAGRARRAAVFESAAGVTPRVRVVLKRPRPTADVVAVRLLVRHATLSRPAACASARYANIETSFNLVAGRDVTHVGRVGTWRCRRRALVVR
jgi:hypothetical protein